MGRGFARERSLEMPRTRRAARTLVIALAVAMAAGSAGVANGQCTNVINPGPPIVYGCVKWHSAVSATTGQTAATQLEVVMSVPSTTECPDAMFVAAISVTNNPIGQSPVLAETIGATWDENDDGFPVNMQFESGASVFSDSTNDFQHLHSEIWTLKNPAPTTSLLSQGKLTFTLADSATARMYGGGIVLCGVDNVVARSGFNNQQSATNTFASLEPANGRMLIDNCAVDGNLTGNPVPPYMSENWNDKSGPDAADILGMSSRVAMVNTFSGGVTQWGVFSSPTFYACSAITFGPTGTTSVGLEDFSAKAFRDGVALTWRAGQEADNLGYRVYREDAGERVLVTPELIAGSALSYPGSPLQAGYAYGWWDPGGRSTSRYWLEDVELGGRDTLHGPIRAELGQGDEPIAGMRRARLVSAIGETEALKAAQVVGGAGMRPVLDRPEFQASEASRRRQQALAAGEAAKVVVSQEGWHRITGADLANAGVSFLGSDPRSIQLFVNGTEQAIRVDDGGDHSFDAVDSIEFYGVPLDTQWAGTQTYWLVKGTEQGERIATHGQLVKGGAPVTTTYTTERKPRVFYAGGILNGEKENFFGRTVTATEVIEHLGTPSADGASSRGAVLEVALQGFSGIPHEVQVKVNGTVVGFVPFEGKTLETASFTVSPELLRGGSAAVSFRETGDPKAVSAVDYVRITYPRISRAQNDHVYFSMSSADVDGPVRISGFSVPGIRVFDVTVPGQVSEVRGSVDPNPGADPAIGGTGYSIDFAPLFVRWQGPEPVRHFLAVSDGAVLKPVAITANTPSRWTLDQEGADYIAIAHRSLIPALAELKVLREGQGLKVAVIDVEDVYDEVGFGVKSPQAIRDFLRVASATWQKSPRYVLLVGDASQDPRNYLGRGQDLVPTKLVDTKTVETASDDWMADLDEDGLPDIALGRIPAETRDEAAAIVAKIVRHEKAARGMKKALFIADTAVLSNFAYHNGELRDLLPASVSVVAADADEMGDTATRTAILEAIAGGVDFVHYSGHGTIDRWRGGLLTVNDVPSLKNGERLPIFTVTNCLTGIFQEPLMQGLGEVLVKTPDAGAVAVWASSGTTGISGQEALMTGFMKAISDEGGSKTLGEAAMRAKTSVADPDVRATWILLGDPATRVR